MVPPFDLDHAPPVGTPERLAAGLRVVNAPNAGPMTFTGTRTYLVGEGEVAVIDPGPDDPRHRAALVAALGAERVAAVLVTHAHRDHSAGARAFAAEVGAEVLAHGDPVGALRPDAARWQGIGGGEGLDSGFRPDRRIGEGAVLRGPGWTLTALATPGHTGDHLAFAWAEANALFSGDLVMGWATTLISPPDGDLGEFRASLRRLQARPEAVYYPGHGAPVVDPQAVIAYVLGHRAEREGQNPGGAGARSGDGGGIGCSDLSRCRSRFARRCRPERSRPPARSRRSVGGGRRGGPLAAGRPV